MEKVIITETKVCQRCKTEYTLDHSNFPRMHKKKYSCRACLNAKHKEHCERNKEKTSERKKRYREANRDKLRDYDKNYRVTHRKITGYKEADREADRIKHHRKMAKKAGVESSFGVKLWKQCKAHFENKCAYCGKEEPLTQDHFIPFSKGGSYTKCNIVPVCFLCNSSKQNQDFTLWYKSQEFFDDGKMNKVIEYLRS